MEATTHYALGALTTATIAPPAARLLGLDLSAIELAAGVGIGTLAGVLPDIDHPRSLITRGLLPLRGRGEGIAMALGQLLSIPPRLVGVFARSVFAHRGATHSLVFLIIWAVLAAPLYAALACGLAIIVSYGLDLGAKLTGATDPLRLEPGPVFAWLAERTPEVVPLVVLCVSCGYLSHLIADAMTKAPIRLFWPHPRRVWALPAPLRIDTGGRFERYLLRPLAILAACVVIALQIGLPLRDEIADRVDATRASSVAGVPGAGRFSRVGVPPAPARWMAAARLPLGAREIIKLIEAEVRQTGSHRQSKHPTKPGKVTVAGKPATDAPKGTTANIL